MQLNNYPFVKVEEVHYYEFNSRGPKGVVKKIVLYDNRNFQANPIFNLVFGDWDPLNDQPNENVVTNNNDRKKVLSTVAATVLHFLTDRPSGVIVAKGSSPARNRLYRMGIGLILDQIKDSMDLYGFLGGWWHPFTKSLNFEAFLLAHKYLKFNPNDQKIIV